MNARMFDDQSPKATAKGKKSKGFFALDVDQFFKIQDKGLGIEEAATYLALMKSTDETNTISRGGINSIADYTGLTRAEARRAIENLARSELVEKLDVERARARTVPRFKLPAFEGRAPLTALEASVVAKIEAGSQPTTGQDRNSAFRAQQKGWIEKLSTGWATVPASRRIAFIPNIFVHMEGQTSPLGRLVQIGEIGPVMLAAELYHQQDLMNARGIPVETVTSYFRSIASRMVGDAQIGFRMHLLQAGRIQKGDDTTKTTEKTFMPDKFHDKGEVFWESLRALERAHLVEWAIFSANGKPKGKFDVQRPQRPLGVLRNGKQVQNTPEAEAAFKAYWLWAKQECLDKGLDGPRPDETINSWRLVSPLVAVEDASVTHVEGVGILRMVYRADTENTAVWFRDLHKEKHNALFFLERIRKAAFPESLEIQWDGLTRDERDADISMRFKV